jgi:hypothetical protein
MGRHAGVPSDHVENWRATGNASQAVARLDVELHLSAYHTGLIRSRPSCVPVLCLKVFLTSLGVSQGSPSQA